MKMSFSITVLALMIALHSCKKENTSESNNPPLARLGRIQTSLDRFAGRLAVPTCSFKDPVAYYSEKLKGDSLFRRFIFSIVDNHERVYQRNRSAFGSKTVYDQFVSSFMMLSPGDDRGTLLLLLRHKVDTSFFLDCLATAVTDGVLFFQDNPCFFQLPKDQQLSILTNVLTAIDPASKLTWGEFTTCAVAAIGGFIGTYGGVIGQVYTMLTQGSGYLSWGDVWSLSKKIVRASVSWWSVVGTLIQFGTCLWAAW